MTNLNPIFTIYTDGSVYPNPNGYGGFAALIIDNRSGAALILTGGEKDSTNNRMEMLAALHALQVIPIKFTCEVTSDSQYVVKGVNKWLPNWLSPDGLINSTRKNSDLWQQMANLLKTRSDINTKPAFHWVRGHNNHIYNETCDKYANRARKRCEHGFTAVKLEEWECCAK